MPYELELAEQKRRRRERVTVGILLTMLILLAAVEVHLLRVSSQLPFVNSMFFFGLMNINILLIMVLLFLVFRNAVKLILDERRGKLGSRLKTRLVFCFLLFAVIPSVLLFSISAFYIRSSFDQWFSARIGETLQRSLDVVNSFYQTAEKNGRHFAQKIAVGLEGNESRLRQRHSAERWLNENRTAFGLDAVEFFPNPFAERWLSVHPDRAGEIPAPSVESLKQAFAGAFACKVLNVGKGELVRCPAILPSGKGVVFASTFVPMNLASQLSEISLTYEDFRSGNPLNYPIKSVYFAILSMVTLLIVFAATWTGFYMARRLTVPLEELARGTEEVAHGNLNYVIPPSGSDEMYTLIESFNKMTRDLNENKNQLEASNDHLRKINEELNHRRHYIEVLLESVHSGVVSIEQDGRISMVNSAAQRLLKMEDAKLVGKNYGVMLPRDYREEFSELLRTVQERTKPLRQELRMRRPDGEALSLLVTLSPLRADNGEQIGAVAVFDDVTDIQKVERMAAWREVAKRIAHEIKNPLTPIQLAVQRLRKRYLDKIADDGTFGESTEIILKEVQALKALVGEFSAFARLPEIKPVADSLNDLTLEAVNLYRAAHDSIHFDLVLDENLPPMELDRSQLKRALINLFDNAVAAMQGQGTITVKTERDEKKSLIRISVVDEGCGIDPAAMHQLFEPYFSTKQEGTGLGLAIVQRIVADHGGFVRVAPNLPKGTRFSFEFPEALAALAQRPLVVGRWKPQAGELE
jgi:two-component system, NtrC family, nitrogen regulation sensor histidine kinase NtrY